LDTYPFAGRSLDWLLGTLGVYPVNIAVSDEVIRSAARHPRPYRRRLLKIHNGVPTPVPSAPPEKIRDRWNLPLDKPLLIHVGRTSAQKNPIFLLGVLARLPEAHLVLVGDGELRDELTREIRDRDLQDRVHCLGEVSPEKGHDLMSASNVFVFPSLHEAMPMALLEAMHLGIPIVASDIAPHRDLLSSSSILLRLDEPDRWVTEIGALLGGQQTAAKLQEEERSRVKDFTARSMASSYCKLLI
jgi:glycosyltransferase involved in cell wall biosynthesis